MKFEEAWTNPLLRIYISFVFDDSVTDDKRKPKYARTNILMGGPVEMEGRLYASMREEDDPDRTQDEYFKDFTFYIRDLATDDWDEAKTGNGLRIDLFSMVTFMNDLIE